jgi:hypothetical protein
MRQGDCSDNQAERHRPETSRRTPCSATGTRASYKNYRLVLGGALDGRPGCLARRRVNLRPRFTGKRPAKSERWLKKHAPLHATGSTLLEDFALIEKIQHFDHERIPERVVHARGTGAHGYFQVYESMAKYTRAAFLSDLPCRIQRP